MSTTLPTVADFHARFDGEPAFASVSDATIQCYLTEAQDFVSAAVWGQWYSYGVLFYSAHQLAMTLADRAKGGAAASALEPESKSVGGVSLSRSGGLQAVRENTFKSTKYGARYWELLRQVGAPVIAL